MPQRRTSRGDARQAGPSPAVDATGGSGGGLRPRRRLLVLLAIAGALLVAVLVLRSRQTGPSAEELFQAALADLEQGDSTAAIQRLDAVLSQEPEHAQALLYRGQIAYSQKDYDAARQFFQRVPDSPSRLGSAASYAEGVLLVEQGFAREGERLLRRAVELNPSSLQPHERLLELYAVQMRREEIRRELDAIRRFRPWRLEELVLYTASGERVATPDEGIRQVRRFLEVTPDDPELQRVLARYFMDAEQFAEAEQSLESLLAQHPDDSRAVALLGELKMRQDDLDGAAAALGSLGASAQPDRTFYRSCGRLWLKKGDWQRAADCLAEAARLDPEDATVAHQLGIALSRLDAKEAEAQLRRARQMDHVLRQASRIPNRDQSNVGPLLGIIFDVGSTLMELKRYREATYWFDQALLLDPTSEVARINVQAASEAFRRTEIAAAQGAKPEESPPGLAWATLVERIRAEAAKVEPRTVVAGKTAPPGSIALRDVHEEAGLDFQYFNGDTGFKYLLESMGGGVAVLDYDLDGWPDLYLPQGCRLPYNPNDATHQDRLYRNRGDGRFEDVTLAAGLGDRAYGQGCTVGDYDNDGDPDLFVANYGQSVLYQNNGDGTFSEVTIAAGLKGERWSSSAGFADFDNDGALDLYVASYVDSLRVCRGADGRVATCDPDNFTGEQDRLIRNLGDGRFEDVTTTCGIVAPNGKGLGLVLADLDNDSWTDIYVANDGTPNFLFHNTSGSSGKLSFREVGGLAGVAVNGNGQAEGGMGIACADFEHDGRPDILVTNFIDETNTYYHNLGDLFFEDATRRSGMAAASRPMVGFGVQPVDFDLDGFLDLIVANGHIDDFRFRNERWKMPTQLFRNVGGGRFQDLSDSAGPYFRGEFLGRGVARLDWDRDGDQDVVVVHQDAPLALLSNETTRKGNWLGLELRGVASSRDAIGAKIKIQSGTHVQHLENTSGDGFYSSNERRHLVGLGNSMQVDQVTIQWPSGHVQTLINPSINSTHILVEGE